MTEPVTGPTRADQVWHRLSPRMLLVHPIHEVLRQVPLLVGTLIVGSATGNPVWLIVALVGTVGVGVARWFTTTYRIDTEEVQLRTGLLRRTVLAVPRNRIRSVSTEARLLHRMLGLTVLRVSTGQAATGDTEFELDAVPATEVSRLRAILLAESLTAPGQPEQAAPTGRILARWQPSWLWYSALSFTGLAMILAAVGVVSQLGIDPEVLQDSELAESGLDIAQRLGAAVTVVLVAVVVLVASVLLSVLRSLLTYGNLVLRRDFDVLHLQHGLLRLRENTFDMRRLRGGTLREPLLVRLFGGARLDAVMTGVGGAGEASLLLPPCPASTARSVLADLVERPEAVTGPLYGHGPAAARRRWFRALALPVVTLAALLAGAAQGLLPGWVWVAWVALTAGCVALAVDRVRSLGHRVVDGWLVARAGSIERRRDCLDAEGIIGWTVRQTFFQRRAGVATLIAATAAGAKRYEVLDVPVEWAWAIAGAATPWVGETTWARR